MSGLRVVAAPEMVTVDGLEVAVSPDGMVTSSPGARWADTSVAAIRRHAERDAAARERWAEVTTHEPRPALYLPTLPSVDPVERVTVRGWKREYPLALITRPDGSEVTVQPSNLLTDVPDDDERLQRLLRQRAEAVAAADAARALEGPLAIDVLPDATVTAHLDPVTGLFTATYDGATFKRDTLEGVRAAVWVHALRDYPWTYRGGLAGDPAPVRLEDELVESVPHRWPVWRTREAVEAYLTAHRAHQAAAYVARRYHQALRFDPDRED